MMLRISNWLAIITTITCIATVLLGFAARTSNFDVEAFFAISSVSVILLVLCVGSFSISGTPSHGWLKLAFGAIPFAFFWAILLAPKNRNPDENMCRGQMLFFSRGIAGGVDCFSKSQQTPSRQYSQCRCRPPAELAGRIMPLSRKRRFIRGIRS